MNSLRKDLFLQGLDLAHHSRTGLFGTSLRLNSLIMLGDRREASYEPKASYRSDRLRFIQHGEPYNYANDKQYFAALRAVDDVMLVRSGNLYYLKALKENKLVILPDYIADHSAFGRNKPMTAHPPSDNGIVDYAYPSYVIWENDPSYVSFFGSPEGLEIPKHVLEQARGCAPRRSLPRYNPGYGVCPKRITLSLSPMAGGNKR